MKDSVCNAKRNLEMAMNELNAKGGNWSPSELDSVHKILSALCKVEEMEAMDRQKNEMSSWSGANVHVPTINGMPNFNGSWGNQNGNMNAYNTGRSGHSTKDRMIAALENMMGQAQNDYERQEILEEIRRIESSERR